MLYDVTGERARARAERAVAPATPAPREERDRERDSAAVKINLDAFGELALLFRLMFGCCCCRGCEERVSGSVGWQAARARLYISTRIRALRLFSSHRYYRKLPMAGNTKNDDVHTAAGSTSLRCCWLVVTSQPNCIGKQTEKAGP